MVECGSRKATKEDLVKSSSYLPLEVRKVLYMILEIRDNILYYQGIPIMITVREEGV